MPYFRSITACIGAICAAFCATSARADFETTEAPAGVYTNPFSLSPVNATLTFSLGYDSNVVLAPDLPPFWPPGAKRDSTYIAFAFNGAWVHALSAATTVGIAGEISGVNYFNDQNPAYAGIADDPSDYTRYAIHPKIFLSHRIELEGGSTLTLTPSYGFRHEGGGSISAIGLNSHQLRFDAAYSPNGKSTFSGHLLYEDNDFDVVFPLNPTSNRDGEFYEAGVSWRYKPVPSRAVTLGAAYQENDSQGSDWQFDGFKLFAEAEMHLGRAYFGTFGVSYADRDYATGFNYLVPIFMPAPRTSQQVLGLSARVLKPLDDRRALQAVITHDSYMANTPAFSGDKTTIEFSYIVSLP